jgi:hypothetical protein
MRMLTLLFLISLSCSSYAQKKSMFVRVYDLSGKKIQQGHRLKITDSSLQLTRKRRPLNIPFQRIGFIKTKNSGNGNVFVGTVAGAAFGAIWGATNGVAEDEIMPYAEGIAAFFGGSLGAACGALIGGITTLFKPSKVYLINGDPEKWKVFRLRVTGKRVE